MARSFTTTGPLITMIFSPAAALGGRRGGGNLGRRSLLSRLRGGRPERARGRGAGAETALGLRSLRLGLGGLGLPGRLRRGRLLGGLRGRGFLGFDGGGFGFGHADDFLRAERRRAVCSLGGGGLASLDFLDGGAADPPWRPRGSRPGRAPATSSSIQLGDRLDGGEPGADHLLGHALLDGEGGGQLGGRPFVICSAKFSSAVCSLMTSISQPVIRVARRVFWPFLPSARE